MQVMFFQARKKYSVKCTDYSKEGLENDLTAGSWKAVRQDDDTCKVGLGLDQEMGIMN